MVPTANPSLASKFSAPSFPGGIFLEMLLSRTPVNEDPATTAVSGGFGMPSPPDRAFIMVKVVSFTRRTVQIHAERNDRQNQKLKSEFIKLCYSQYLPANLCTLQLHMTFQNIQAACWHSLHLRHGDMSEADN
jgi:hypothetical protein